jgi:ribosomal protein S18 acetylase RimI-like enzyme
MERAVRFAEEKAEGGRGVVVTVLVMEGNEAARRLYEGCGFVVRAGGVGKDGSNSEVGNVVLAYRSGHVDGRE